MRRRGVARPRGRHRRAEMATATARNEAFIPNERAEAWHPLCVDGPSMATLLQEGLVEMFRAQPALAPDLLRHLFRAELPPFREITVETNYLTALSQPSPLPHSVVVLRHGAPVFSVVVEAQPAVDRDRPALWLLQVTELQAKTNAPAALLLLAKDEAVAAYCEGPFFYGHPSLSLKPFVLGPRSVPLVLDEAWARPWPEFACLSAWVHSRSPHAHAAGNIALKAIMHLDDQRRRLYAGIVLGGSLARERLLAEFPSLTDEWR